MTCWTEHQTKYKQSNGNSCHLFSIHENKVMHTVSSYIITRDTITIFCKYDLVQIGKVLMDRNQIKSNAVPDTKSKMKKHTCDKQVLFKLEVNTPCIS